MTVRALATWAWWGPAAALAILGACSRGPSVLVELDDLPAATARLEARATLAGGAASMPNDWDAPAGGFGASTTFVALLPDGTKGTLHVDATAFDASGCALATGGGDVVVGDGARLSFSLGGEGRCGALDGGTPDRGDDGATLEWTPAPAPTTKSLRGVFAYSSVSVFIVGDAGTVFVGGVGSAWMDLGAPLAQYRGVWSDGPSVVAVGDAGLSVSPDHGNTWSVQAPAMPAVAFDAVATFTTVVTAVGQSGVIVQSPNGGVSWSELSSSATADDLHGIAAVGTHLYAVGAGVAAASLDGGKSWSAVLVQGGAPLFRAVWGLTDDDLWAVGDQQAIFHSSDGKGAAWSPSTIDQDTDLHGVWGASASDFYVVGDLGIHHTVDHGAHWTLFPSSEPLYAIAGTGASDVWAVGRGGTVLHKGK